MTPASSVRAVLGLMLVELSVVEQRYHGLLDHNDELVIIVARTNPAEPTRHKVYGYRSGT